MNDSAERLEVAIVEGIDKISRDAWDGLLAPDDSPFLEWDWLYAMEHSGSATRKTGWAPYHLIVREGPKKRVVAACPLYLKTHSMGEFVFDHGWADAAEGAGIRYFPKLMVGVPFTPHTGRRFLTAARANRAGLINLLGLALTSICEDNKLSSVHVNFCQADEAAALAPIGFMERLGYQYHWHNAGFATFDDYLARLKHKRRTAVRHERSALAEQGIEIRVHAGEEIPDRMFAEMFRIYCSTIEKLYWGRQYLTRRIFRHHPRPIQTQHGFHRRVSRPRAGRRRRQFGQGRRDVRPLLGMLPRRALPALQCLLLRRHRALDTERHPALRAGRGRRIQMVARLRPGAHPEHPLRHERGTEKGGWRIPEARTHRGRAMDRRWQRAQPVEGSPTIRR